MVAVFGVPAFAVAVAVAVAAAVAAALAAAVAFAGYIAEILVVVALLGACMLVPDMGTSAAGMAIALPARSGAASLSRDTFQDR